ncbi:phosphatase [Clostridium carboxidivorans P7]|uniref:Phosphoesterase PA-phosphatase related n=1 Tax=Clostridium carboxidivorans P7 TaxID=536227 RepID=C6PU78_9CLOT|nr:undecaprenyl-diphosphatase [Clostridium carboxidivorans]AKN31378.1 phosphatase [Clostridium carboxidivorans P7]EET87176.1 phosphoesterase PA-phosphatase related [Clostridium carboxidivorans P7]EFG87230.1 PAP2 family protein [Clostridium carboxidivorans P7]
MNMEFFRLINDLANKNAVLDKIMVFFSKDVPYIFMAITALVFVLGVIKKNEEYRKVSISTCIISAINLILSFIIGIIYYEDRPFVNNKVNLLIIHAKNASFPSDHAAGTMSVALGLGKYNRILGRIMAVVSIIVGFSRVYVGNHYPLDVIGAYIMVFVTNYLYNFLLRNKIQEFYIKIEKLLISKAGFCKNTGKNILND